MPSSIVASLKCPNCGAGLEVSPDMQQFACGYCGSEQIVDRRGGTVSLKLISDAITNVQYGTDRTAAELAIKRLRGDLQSIEAEILARPSRALIGGEWLFFWSIVSCFYLYGAVLLLGAAESGSAAKIMGGFILPLIGWKLTNSRFKRDQDYARSYAEFIKESETRKAKITSDIERQLKVVDQ